MAEIIAFESYKDKSREDQHSDDNVTGPIDEIIKEIKEIDDIVYGPIILYKDGKK